MTPITIKRRSPNRTPRPPDFDEAGAVHVATMSDLRAHAASDEFGTCPVVFQVFKGEAKGVSGRDIVNALSVNGQLKCCVMIQV